MKIKMEDKIFIISQHKSFLSLIKIDGLSIYVKFKTAEK